MPIMILVAAAAAAANPIAPGLAGKLRCQGPNETAKTCQSIVSYKDAGDGTYLAHSSVMLRPEPLVIADSDTKALVRDGNVCATIRSADIDAATISLGGTPLDDAMATMVKGKIKEKLPGLDKEVCATFTQQGSDWVSTPIIDGKPDATKTQKFTWIAPTDGYKVGP